MSKKKKLMLAIYGSPRPGGNTTVLMDRFLEGFKEGAKGAGADIDIKKVKTSALKISPCRECGHCSKTGDCIVDDDMQKIYRQLVMADFIAVSSPVFFTTVSGYLKALIDRCQRFWVLKYEKKVDIIGKKRKGIFIGASGSDSDDIFECPKKVIRAFFDVIYIDYMADFLYGDTDSKGDILSNRTALDDIYEYGKEIIRER